MWWAKGYWNRIFGDYRHFSPPAHHHSIFAPCSFITAVCGVRHPDQQLTVTSSRDPLLLCRWAGLSVRTLYTIYWKTRTRILVLWMQFYCLVIGNMFRLLMWRFTNVSGYYAEDRDNRFLRNGDKPVPGYTASHLTWNLCYVIGCRFLSE
jgi:hypothetical protein